jgi:phosphate uptake regulator
LIQPLATFLFQKQAVEIRMNRTTKTPVSDSPSELMGTLAIMGFAAEDNLRNVAQALAKRDRNELGRVEERNAKQARLRAEIEEQIVAEMAQLPAGTRHSRKLILASRVASLFERMGVETVEIARLCDQVICDPKPSRVADIRKLIEHAVYITDRAATGLVEEDLEMTRIAREQNRAAAELNARINQELAAFAEARADARPRIDLLCRIACKAQGMIEEAGRLTEEVTIFLESPEL